LSGILKSVFPIILSLKLEYIASHQDMYVRHQPVKKKGIIQK